MIKRRCAILPGIAIVALIVLVAAYSSRIVSGWSQEAGFNADHPEESGYKLVFQDDFTNPSTLDIKDTRKEGFNWYMGKFHWGDVSTPEQVVLGPDGLQLGGRIATATSSFDDRSVIGKAWGGTLYFEALINLNPTHVFSWKGTGPAFWALSWPWSTRSAQAPNMPQGYENFGELDVMEYGFANKPGSSPDLKHYSQTVHNWYGIDRTTCKPDAYCEILNDDRTVRVPDIRGWHRFGAWLVIGKGGRKSFVQPYYDGAPVGFARKWPSYAELKDVPVPPSGSNSYGIFDFEKWIVVLSATMVTPMKVRYVKIWQAG